MTNLHISREAFTELYPDIADKYDFFNNPVPFGISSRTFEQEYLASKLWRLNNCYKIIDKQGKVITFRMNKAQHKVYAASRVHPRVIILKSRQQGISTLWLISMFDDAIFAPYLNIGLMAQGTDEAATLLERTKFLWDNLSTDIKEFLGIRLVKDNQKEFSFSNKSTIFIRVSFRSTTLQRLHISEYGKIANANPQRAKETKTGTLQALAQGNTGIIESTAEGDNDFKRMWQASVLTFESKTLTSKDFMPVFLSWLDDPDCAMEEEQAETKESKEYFANLEKEGIYATQKQKNFWIAQYRELADDIYQEYPATPEEAFSAKRDGRYYASQFTLKVIRKGRVRADVYDPNLPVHVFFDLGVDDYFVMAFTQYYRGEYRIIDEFYENGKWLGYYLDITFKRGYNIGSLVFPHDITVREQGTKGESDLAVTRLDIVRKHMRANGYHAKIFVIKRSSEAEGIEAVRHIIPNMVVDKRCSYILDCMLNFTKEFDDKSQTWKNTPAKTEWNHGADVIRLMAQGMPTSTAINETRLKTPDHYRRKMSGHDV